jgi:hypothetical protein
MFYVYTLKNGDEYFYVGSTGNWQDRKHRHFTRQSKRTKDFINKESIFEIDSEFNTRREAEDYEMVLACALLGFGYNLQVKRVGRRDHTKLYNRKFESYSHKHTEETKKKVSVTKKESYPTSSARMFLEESNKLRCRKIMIDGVVYPSKREASRVTGMDRKMMDYWIKKGSDRVCYV